MSSSCLCWKALRTAVTSCSSQPFMKLRLRFGRHKAQHYGQYVSSIHLISSYNLRSSAVSLRQDTFAASRLLSQISLFCYTHQTSIVLIIIPPSEIGIHGFNSNERIEEPNKVLLMPLIDVLKNADEHKSSLF